MSQITTRSTAPIAGHLTVFQRSPQYVVPIGNTPQDEATIAQLESYIQS